MFTASMFKANNPPSLTYEDMVYMLMQSCKSDVPGEGEMKFTKTKAGKPVVFVPEKALATLKQDWNSNGGPSPFVKKMFSSLPWADTWMKMALGDSKRVSRLAAKKVSKENKVTLLRIFHPTRAPTYKDSYPIRVGDGYVYNFRPTDWLPDIAGNWLGGHRHHVVLSAEDKKAIETLPWFDSWLDRLRILRERKRCREDTQIEPYYAVPHGELYKGVMGDIMNSDGEDEDYGLPDSQ